MARTPSPTLTEAEHRIMSVLWERGEASVRDLTDALEPAYGLAYTTVLPIIHITVTAPPFKPCTRTVGSTARPTHRPRPAGSPSAGRQPPLG